MLKIFKKIEDITAGATMEQARLFGFLKFLCGMLVFVHVIGCFWYFSVGEGVYIPESIFTAVWLCTVPQARLANFHDDTWVVRHFSQGIIGNEEAHKEFSLASKYLASIYFVNRQKGH